MMQKAQFHQVVILGGGFGGLYAAKALRRASVRVTLVDKRNFHLFQPLLYQVATGGVSPGDIAYPLRSVFARDAHFSVIMAEASDIDVSQRTVILRDGSLTYDTLIIATGASHQYFGHDEWAQTVPGLKTIADALEIRRLAHRVFHTCWPEKNRWEGMDCKVSVERPQPATSVVPQTPTWRIGSTIKGL